MVEWNKFFKFKELPLLERKYYKYVNRLKYKNDLYMFIDNKYYALSDFNKTKRGDDFIRFLVANETTAIKLIISEDESMYNLSLVNIEEVNS